MESILRSFGRLILGPTDAHQRAVAGTLHKKILLVGQTGSGKTSFLNLLCNLELIRALGFEASIEQFRNFNDMSLENAASESMVSKTETASLYKVRMCDKDVGLIDSPGFGDSRGMAFDKRHVEKIVECLKAVEAIHCICLVINGREARMTATLQYVLTQITSIMPHSILRNIVVVFTNTADVLELNFDIQELAKFIGCPLPCEHVFYIENPYCKVEKAKARQGSVPLQQIAASLKKSFQETAAVLEKLSECLAGLEQVCTNDFLRLYDMKQHIERQMLNLLADHDYQTKLEKQLAAAADEAAAARSKADLHRNFRSTQTIRRWQTRPTARHNTLCGYAGCRSNCHTPCHLEKSMDKEAFRHCTAIGGDGNCQQCGHQYTYHHHDEVEWHEVTESQTREDSQMRSIFDSQTSLAQAKALAQQQFQAQLAEAQRKKRDLGNELTILIYKLQDLGVNRNYLKLLRCQHDLVEQHLEAAKAEALPPDAALEGMRQELQKQIKLVEQMLREPWSSPDSDFKLRWARELLGLGESFDQRAVEQSYLAKAKALHPDKAGGDSAMFQSLQQAKNILCRAFSSGA